MTLIDWATIWVAIQVIGTVISAIIVIPIMIFMIYEFIKIWRG
jgi:hypothetical protein